MDTNAKVAKKAFIAQRNGGKNYVILVLILVKS